MPAESLELSAMDAVFVRMGAQDNIMAGQSTFFVELAGALRYAAGPRLRPRRARLAHAVGSCCCPPAHPRPAGCVNIIM